MLNRILNANKVDEQTGESNLSAISSDLSDEKAIAVENSIPNKKSKKTSVEKEKAAITINSAEVDAEKERMIAGIQKYKPLLVLRNEDCPLDHRFNMMQEFIKKYDPTDFSNRLNKNVIYFCACEHGCFRFNRSDSCSHGKGLHVLDFVAGFVCHAANYTKRIAQLNPNPDDNESIKKREIKTNKQRERRKKIKEAESKPIQKANEVFEHTQLASQEVIEKSAAALNDSTITYNINTTNAFFDAKAKALMLIQRSLMDPYLPFEEHIRLATFTAFIKDNNDKRIASFTVLFYCTNGCDYLSVDGTARHACQKGGVLHARDLERNVDFIVNPPHIEAFTQPTISTTSYETRVPVINTSVYNSYKPMPNISAPITTQASFVPVAETNSISLDATPVKKQMISRIQSLAQEKVTVQADAPNQDIGGVSADNSARAPNASQKSINIELINTTPLKKSILKFIANYASKLKDEKNDSMHKFQQFIDFILEHDDASLPDLATKFIIYYCNCGCGYIGFQDRNGHKCPTGTKPLRLLDLTNGLECAVGYRINKINKINKMKTNGYTPMSNLNKNASNNTTTTSTSTTTTINNSENNSNPSHPPTPSNPEPNTLQTSIALNDEPVNIELINTTPLKKYILKLIENLVPKLKDENKNSIYKFKQIINFILKQQDAKIPDITNKCIIYYCDCGCGHIGFQDAKNHKCPKGIKTMRALAFLNGLNGLNVFECSVGTLSNKYKQIQENRPNAQVPSVAELPNKPVETNTTTTSNPTPPQAMNSQNELILKLLKRTAFLFMNNQNKLKEIAKLMMANHASVIANTSVYYCNDSQCKNGYMDFQCSQNNKCNCQADLYQLNYKTGTVTSLAQPMQVEPPVNVTNTDTAEPVVAYAEKKELDNIEPPINDDAKMEKVEEDKPTDTPEERDSTYSILGVLYKRNEKGEPVKIDFINIPPMKPVKVASLKGLNLTRKGIKESKEKLKIRNERLFKENVNDRKEELKELDQRIKLTSESIKSNNKNIEVEIEELDELKKLKAKIKATPILQGDADVTLELERQAAFYRKWSFRLNEVTNERNKALAEIDRQFPVVKDDEVQTAANLERQKEEQKKIDKLFTPKLDEVLKAREIERVKLNIAKPAMEGGAEENLPDNPVLLPPLQRFNHLMPLNSITINKIDKSGKNHADFLSTPMETTHEILFATIETTRVLPKTNADELMIAIDNYFEAYQLAREINSKHQLQLACIIEWLIMLLSQLARAYSQGTVYPVLSKATQGNSSTLLYAPLLLTNKKDADEKDFTGHEDKLEDAVAYDNQHYMLWHDLFVKPEKHIPDVDPAHDYAKHPTVNKAMALKCKKIAEKYAEISIGDLGGYINLIKRDVASIRKAMNKNEVIEPVTKRKLRNAT